MKAIKHNIKKTKMKTLSVSRYNEQNINKNLKFYDENGNLETFGYVVVKNGKAKFFKNAVVK